jgi:hypothetical protein
VGRFAELCAEVAAEADETPEGLVLPEDALARLHAMGWADDDISDALEFVHAAFIQNELLEAADALSGRLVGVLGAFGEAAAFRAALAGRAQLTLETIAQLARSVSYLEEVIAPLREGSPVDRSGFQRLIGRLAEREEPPAQDAEPPPKTATRAPRARKAPARARPRK